MLPNEWVVKRICEFTTCTAGGTPSTKVSKYWGGSIRWMNSGELNFKHIHEVEGRITVAGLNNSSTKMIPELCVLIGLAGQGKTRGTTAMNFVPLCTNQSIAAIIPNSSFIPEYLYHVLDSRYDELRDLSSGGGGRGGLNLSLIKSIPIPFPPLSEQRVIAEALSNVDGLIGALGRLIAKKRAIKQAAMQQLLTGKTRLPGFEGEWETKRLGQISHIKTGSRNNEDKVENGQYPFFVRSDIVERINTYSYDCEAILIPGEGRIGSIFHYICGRFDVHQRVYAINQFASDIFARYILYYMTKNFGFWAMQNTVKATVDSLRLPTFLDFEIKIPKIEEQIAIATVLSDIDDEISALMTRRDKTKSIKQGMMQQLLTGRIRLVKPEETK